MHNIIVCRNTGYEFNDDIIIYDSRQNQLATFSPFSKFIFRIIILKFMNLYISQSTYYKRRRRTEGSILSSSNIIYIILFGKYLHVVSMTRVYLWPVPTEYFIPHNRRTTVLVRSKKKKK